MCRHDGRLHSGVDYFDSQGAWGASEGKGVDDGRCGSLSFLGMMFNVPLPGGTTGHAVGGTLAAILLGPYAPAFRYPQLCCCRH